MKLGNIGEDLVDASWDMGNLCNGWLPFEHSNKLRALVCRDDLEAAEKATENYPLIFVRPGSWSYPGQRRGPPKGGLTTETPDKYSSPP